MMEVFKENGVLHREDGPALTFTNHKEEIEQHWYVNGVLERSIVDGETTWFDTEGRKHRIDGPASIDRDGTERWCTHGAQHRDDGPAVIRKDGSKAWVKYGKLHRESGPSYIPGTDTEWRSKLPMWSLDGKNYPFDVWCAIGNLSEAEKVELKMKYL